MSFLKNIGKIVALGVGGSILADQFSGNKQQKDINKQAMKAWTLMNDYNSPAAQVARLEAAGLNKYLITPSGNTTSSPALVGGGVGTTGQNFVKGASAALGVLQGKANLAQTQAQTVATHAAAGASNAAAQASQASAANTDALAQINKVRAGLEKKSMIADIDYKLALTKNLQLEAGKHYFAPVEAFYKTAAAKYQADLLRSEAEFFGNVAGGKSGAQLGAKALGAIGSAIIRKRW